MENTAEPTAFQTAMSNAIIDTEPFLKKLNRLLGEK